MRSREPRRKPGVCSEESRGFLGGKSDFARRKLQGRKMARKRAALRLPKVLINNVYFCRKKCAPF